MITDKEMDVNVFELFEKIREEYQCHIGGIERIYAEILAYIAGSLMSYRKEHELTQEELAQRLGMPPKTIADIEAGIWDVSISELAYIVGTLGGEIKLGLRLGKVGEEREMRCLCEGGLGL